MPRSDISSRRPPLPDRVASGRKPLIETGYRPASARSRRPNKGGVARNLSFDLRDFDETQTERDHALLAGAIAAGAVESQPG